MNLHEILSQKGTKVYRIEASATLQQAVAALVQHNCGSLMVCDGEKTVGIITERDILRACNDRVDLDTARVEERMTRELVTARPEAPISEVMGLLTRRRIRHLPVVQGESILGLVSIGDVVKAQHDELTLENHYLKEYLMG